MATTRRYGSGLPRVSRKGLRVAVILGCATSTLAACSPEIELEDEQDIQTDVEVYIRALCEDKCAKHIECAPLPDDAPICTVEGCVDASFSMLDAPCFAHDDELFRCRTERLSCDDYFDPRFNMTSAMACPEFLEVLGECLERHDPDR